MNGHPGKHRRRNFFSQPRTQLRIILFFVLLALVFSLLNSYINTYAFGRFGLGVLSLDLPTAARRDVTVLYEQHRETLILQLVVFTVLSVGMLVLAGVLLSHRIGGPIYHLKKYLKDVVSDRQAARAVRFRQDDFFIDLADAFNEFQRSQGLLGPGGEKQE